MENRYNYLEPVLHQINSNFVALNEEEKRRNNIILAGVLEVLLSAMRTNNKLFDSLFRGIYYGGSYYDKLKVSQPNEYDLDVLLDLPPDSTPTVMDTTEPGFVTVQLANKSFEKKVSSEYTGLRNKLFDCNSLLSTNKVLRWMESILNKVLDEFPSRKITIKSSNGDHETVLERKQGPAFTLRVSGEYNNKRIKINIDLVPCFVFKNTKLPCAYRENDYLHNWGEFFVVPKEKRYIEDYYQFWRLSFQQQEGELIRGKERLKPALRLLKRLRDQCRHDKIASYYIKTIFLWEVVKDNSASFWNESLSYVFMTMLKKYQRYLANGDIPFFWNEENNLLADLDPDNKRNISNHLIRIIRDFETCQNDPSAIFKYFGTLHVECVETTEPSRDTWTCSIL